MWWVAPTFWTLNYFRHQLIRTCFRIFIQCSREKLACNILPHSTLARACIRMQPSSENQLGHAPSFLVGVHIISSLSVWEDAVEKTSGPRIVFLERKCSIYRRNKIYLDFSTSWVRFGNSWSLRNLFTAAKSPHFLEEECRWVCLWERFNFCSVCTSAILFVLVQFPFSFIPVASGVVDLHRLFWGYLQLL